MTMPCSVGIESVVHTESDPWTFSLAGSRCLGRRQSSTEGGGVFSVSVTDVELGSAGCCECGGCTARPIFFIFFGSAFVPSSIPNFFPPPLLII